MSGPGHDGFPQLTHDRNRSTEALVAACSSGTRGTRESQSPLEFCRRICHARTVDAADSIMSLFSGVGGIEKGLDEAGLGEIIALCESWAPAQAVLEQQYPGVHIHSDVTELRDFSGATLVTAGFPCTDLSQAGGTRGLDGLASGLVRKVFSLLPGARPRWLLIENVRNMLHLGRGSALREITSALEVAGYEWAYRVIDSRAFGLPQRRRRIYILASLEGGPAGVLFRSDHPSQRPDGGARGAWSNAYGFYWTEGNNGVGWAIDAVPTLKGGTTISIPSPPGVWLPDRRPGGRIVRPSIESAERLQGFSPGWTSAAPTKDRWKLIGNAVSVPVARWIGEGLLRETPFAHDSLDQRPLPAGETWPTAAYRRNGKVWRVEMSEWPTAPSGSGRHLSTILGRHGSQPLSHRAAAGFRDRLRRSSLRYDERFMNDLTEHVALTQ